MALAQEVDGIFTDDDHAPAVFAGGYLKEILKEDHSKEIKDCWKVQSGLKDVMDEAYKGLNDPDKQKDTYKQMRKETVYPKIAAGLEGCEKAGPAWKKVADVIDALDWFEIERVWDHCYIKCGEE